VPDAAPPRDEQPPTTANDDTSQASVSVCARWKGLRDGDMARLLALLVT